MKGKQLAEHCIKARDCLGFAIDDLTQAAKLTSQSVAGIQFYALMNQACDLHAKLNQLMTALQHPVQHRLSKLS